MNGEWTRERKGRSTTNSSYRKHMTMDRLGLNVIAKSISVEIYSWSQQVSDLEFF